MKLFLLIFHICLPLHAVYFSVCNNLVLAEMRGYYLPLLIKHDVDLVLGGHSHIYQRSTGSNVAPKSTLIVSGGGGGALETERVEYFHIFNVTEVQHHFLLINWQPCRLNIRAITELKLEIDNFNIVSSLSRCQRDSQL